MNQIAKATLTDTGWHVVVTAWIREYQASPGTYAVSIAIRDFHLEDPNHRRNKKEIEADFSR